MAIVGRKSLLLSATALIAFASVQALADEKSKSDELVIAQAAAPAPAAADKSKVEKITVTATRRKTALQKTPIAVTAIGERALENSKVENIEDLQALTPSLQITNGGNPAAYTARIRGVGTQGNNAGLESAVGTFIDGVYRSRASVAFGDLGELERIEVLRGPQGTLFGRNTSAGILNILTKRPTFDTDAYAEATVGSFDDYAAKASVNFAAGENLAFRFFGTRHEQEGYIDVNPGRPDAYDGNAKSYFSFRGQALWKLSDKADIRLIGDWSEREDQCCSSATVFGGGNGRTPAALSPFLATGTSAPVIINFIESPLVGKFSTDRVDSQVGFGNRSTNSDIDDKGISGELNWDLGSASLTSITALRNWETIYAQDSDWSGADLIYFADDGQNLTEFETFTHETRVVGDLDWVDYLFGVFYSNEDIGRHSPLRTGTEMERFLSLHRIGDSDLSLRGAIAAFFPHPIGTPLYTPDTPGGLGGDDRYQQNAESFALFTHDVFHLSDSLSLTTGLRWTTETKVFDAVYRSPGGLGCAAVESTLGLNPGAGAGSLAGIVGLTCLPGARHALDVLTATAPHHQERTETEWSGVATLAWEVQENLNTYATYSRGYKAGGFNLDRSFSDGAGSIVVGPAPNTVVAGVVTPNPLFLVPQTVRGPNTSFPAEFVDAYELGLKTILDGGNLFINTAIFYQEFENFQLNTFTGISFIVTPIPGVISQGVEVETAWTTPIDGLSTNLSVQYTDAHYDGLGSLTTPGSFIALNPGLFLLADAQITHAPKWAVTGGFDYDFRLFNAFAAIFHMDARWQSEMNTGSNLDPRKLQQAFAVVGLKFGVYTDDERYGLEFFARNLFDEKYINTAFDSPLQGSSISPTSPGGVGTSTIDAFLGEPRMMGATFRVRY